MKLRKMAAALLAASLCMGFCVPTLAVGNTDARLTQVTQKVKSTLSIPDTYTEFYGEPEENPLGTFWRLEWSKEEASLSVSATDDGKVLSMYSNDSTASSSLGARGDLHFPNLNRAQAQEKAQAFLDRVLTAGETAVFSQNNNSSSLSSGSCSFRGDILLNGLPSPLGFSMRVRLSDGMVTSFNRDDVSEYLGKLPPGESSISQQDAAAKLKTVFDLRLEYVRDEDKSKAVLRYLPEPRDEYYVDAASKELVNLTELQKELSKLGGGANTSASAPEAAAGADMAADNGASLTDVELKGIAHLEDLLSREELDSAARSWTALGLDGFELSSVQFSVDRDDQTVTARLAYGKKLSDGAARRFISLDAKTGALLSVYGSRPYDPKAEAAIDQAAAKAKAEDFLKQLWPEQFAKTELYQSGDVEKRTLQYSFDYAQKVNGYFFPENRIQIQVDALDGTIFGVSQSFDDSVTFDSVNGLISKSDALTVWAKSYPMELSYIQVPVRLDLMGSEAKPLIDAGYSYFNTLKPGYGLQQTDPGYTGVDAKTGQLVERPRYFSDTITYNDLKGHQAESAYTQLAEYQIGWLGGSAEPDAKLTQKDLLFLLASANGRMFSPEEADALYQYAYRQGLITQGQRDDNRQLSRLELVRMLLDSLGFAPAANLAGIYRCDFADAESLPDGSLGYAALAQGLGIASADTAGNFGPDYIVTRSDAVVMLWKYMSR